MGSSDQNWRGSVSTDIYGGIVGVISVIFLCQFEVGCSTDGGDDLYRSVYI